MEKYGQVEPVKDEQYVAMPDSFYAKNVKQMNQGMKYGDMSDLANTPHPLSNGIKGEKRDMQYKDVKVASNDYNYDKNR